MAENPGCIRIIEESSESENDTEPAKNFHRRLSTKKDIKTSVSQNLRPEKPQENKSDRNRKKKKISSKYRNKNKRTSQSKQNFLVAKKEKRKS